MHYIYQKTLTAIILICLSVSMIAQPRVKGRIVDGVDANADLAITLKASEPYNAGSSATPTAFMIKIPAGLYPPGTIATIEGPNPLGCFVQEIGDVGLGFYYLYVVAGVADWDLASLTDTHVPYVQLGFSNPVPVNEFIMAVAGDPIGAGSEVNLVNENQLDVITLPITLMNFDVTKRDSEAHLFWRTATEENTSHFELQRSYDGFNFKAIGEVQAVGNSVEIVDYKFIDERPTVSPLFQGIAYYRLKSIDLDRSFTYSDIRKVNWTGGDDSNFTLYPNPTQETINISLLDTNYKGNVEIEIYDNTGKLVYQESQEIESLINHPINLRKTALEAGMYHITLKGADNFIVDKNFILID